MNRIWIYLLGTLTLIVAATFPWDLQTHPHWYKVGWLPFVTGIVRPHDLLINVALYFPLGLFLPVRLRRGRVAWAAGLALLVSSLLELAQVWSHSRIPSTTDVVMNVVGGMAGAIVATRYVPPE